MAALEGVSLTLAEGTFTAITGPSGCGKSTLLHLLAALDKPTSGEIEVAGVRLDTAGEKERTLYRRRTAGIVFQFFHLLPGMTLEENVSLPLILAGHGAGAAAERSRDLLAMAGLDGKFNRLPHEVSGGEMQRTAVARASPNPAAVASTWPLLGACCPRASVLGRSSNSPIGLSLFVAMAVQ